MGGCEGLQEKALTFSSFCNTILEAYRSEFNFLVFIKRLKKSA